LSRYQARRIAKNVRSPIFWRSAWSVIAPRV
jgi:hypothetical protein